MAEEIFPLSLEQRTAAAPRKLRTWKFSHSYLLDDPVDADALSAALAVVTARHDPLRMRLIAPGNTHQRFVAPTRRLQLPTVDCADTSQAERTAADFFAADLDVVHEGAFRPLLLRMADGRAQLLVAAHHLAWDGLSGDPFARDLWSSYRALRNGRTPELPPIRTTYRQYVCEQRDRGADLSEAQVRYWDGVFRDWRPDQALGRLSSRLPGAGPEWWSGTAKGPEPDLVAWSRVGRIARSLRVTPPAVWLAAAFVALWSSHHDDWVCVYWIHHGRDRPALFDLVGYFSRTIPLRLRLRAADRFDDVCAAAFEQTRSAIRHSAAPWHIADLTERVVGSLPPPTSGRERLRRPRMSHVTVNIDIPRLNPAQPAATSSSSRGEPADPVRREMSTTPRPGRCWLYVTLGDEPGLTAEYDRRRFSDEAVIRYLRTMDAVIGEVADRGPRVSLGELRGRLAH